ncbi:MAG: LysR family transcriptional regulator [Oscillospiraceae bacterium]|nr:LysR family transcriptional regulator [Oscillospiraceae bacterium]
MTFKDLEYFSAVAAEKSITKAAAKMNVAQPALSQCMHKLENEVGRTLLLRGAGGVSLTGEGECFLDFADRVIKERIGLNKRFADLDNAESGEVILGFAGTQATIVLPYILPEFKAKHPGITVHLIESTTDEVEKLLLRHEVDLGITHLPVMSPGLSFFEISRDEMVVVPRADSNFNRYVFEDDKGQQVISMEFFRNEPVGLTFPSQRSRMVCDKIFSNAGIVPDVRQESKNIRTLDALAQVNFVSVIMPKKQLSPSLKERGYFKIPEKYSVPYTFVVASAEDNYLTTAAKKLKEEFKKKQYMF